MIRKRKVDCHTKNAVMYMINAAFSRGMINIKLSFFVYSIFKSSREYLEKFFDQQSISSALSSMIQLIDDGDENEVSTLFDIRYDESIGKLISAVESAELHGVASILLRVIESDDEISQVLLEDSQMMISDIERAARHESGIGKGSGKRRKSSNVPQLPRMPQHPGQKNFELSDYCTDLTERAKEGKIDGVFCRDVEISKVIVSLLRKIKCNPLLIGEPGVGKTAIVEGLALQIVSGKVPERLQGNTILALNMSALVGGTTLRGEFEERVKNLMVEIANRPKVILFVDEVHMIMGAGDHNGAMDASNILKPYLARGEIKCIGATTFWDYNKHMKNDGALVRRFQRVNVSEPTKDQTSEIIRNLKTTFEDYHNIHIRDDAISRIVDLADKHICDRYFPDKAIDCLDEVCARAVILDQEVNSALIEESISDIAGIPLSVIRTRPVDRIDSIRASLFDSIVGNDKALESICDLILSSSSALGKGERPLCSMVLHGPNGIGKKSSIRIAAELMYGPGNVLEINGSDFTEPHSVSKIVGSPPGYVGYSEESNLFSSVRRKPHTFILISQYRLMHPATREQFVRILKEGSINDTQGNAVDFRSSTIVFSEDTTSVSTVGFSHSTEDFQLEKTLWSNIVEETDATISFAPVKGKDLMREISEIEIEAFEQACQDMGKIVKVSTHLSDDLFERFSSFSPSELRRKIRRELERLVSQPDNSNNFEFSALAEISQ